MKTLKFKDEKIKKIYKFDALATHPDYRGKGIATQLIQQALIIAKKSHCDQGNSLKGIDNKTVRRFRRLQSLFILSITFFISKKKCF